MRTTVTLEDDVVSKLKKLCRETGKSFKDAINEAVRIGLSSRKPKKQLKPFKVKAWNMKLRPGIQIDNIGELLDQLDELDRSDAR